MRQTAANYVLVNLFSISRSSEAALNDDSGDFDIFNSDAFVIWRANVPLYVTRVLLTEKVQSVNQQII